MTDLNRPSLLEWRLGLSAVRGAVRPAIAALRARLRDRGGAFSLQVRATASSIERIRGGLLVAAGIGVTGIPLWDGSRPPGYRGGDGRTFGSTAHGRRTALFFTNDSGLHAIEPTGKWASKTREIETVAEREKILGLYEQHRKRLSNHRLEIPRRSPPLFGHNMWDCNMAGSTLFMPVCDVSLSSDLLDHQSGRWRARALRARPRGRHERRRRSAWLPTRRNGAVGKQRLHRQGESPAIVDSRAPGLLLHVQRTCCHLSQHLPCHRGHGHRRMDALRFPVVRNHASDGLPDAGPADTGAFANPVGLDGVLEGYCPPYYRTMNEAVDTVVARMSRKDPSAITAAEPTGSAHDGGCGVP